jgi:hypothetical protein
MKIGTKSVLFGAHCFLLHPWFVLWAWIKLYGFPWDPRLWVAFFVHDLGYWGKPNMDGPEGETHVELGAKIMGWLFDWKKTERDQTSKPGEHRIGDFYQGGIIFYLDPGGKSGLIAKGKKPIIRFIKSTKWADFSRYHSRFYAKKDGVNPSRLCMADKLAICLEPAWFYLLRVNLSGEIREYMKLAQSRIEANEKVNKYESMGLNSSDQKAWFHGMRSYLLRWVEEHKDGREDSWTPKIKQAIDINGVWK